jgi:hypothetical protein
MNSTYFGLLAEFGEANIPLEKIAAEKRSRTEVLRVQLPAQISRANALNLYLRSRRPHHPVLGYRGEKINNPAAGR